MSRVLPRPEERAPGPGLAALPRLRPGTSLGAARAVGREPGTPRPGLGLSPPLGGGRLPVPGLSGEEVRDRRAAGPGQRVWSEEWGQWGRGKRGTGQRLLGRPGTRRPGQPSAPGLARDPRLAPGDSRAVVLGGGGKGGPRGSGGLAVGRMSR